jgi:hypothetical protein
MEEKYVPMAKAYMALMDFIETSPGLTVRLFRLLDQSRSLASASKGGRL